MNPTQGRISQTTERLSLALAGVVVIAIGFFAYASNRAFRVSVEQADSTHQVVDTTNALLSALKDAETGQRGFLLTGEDRYLEPYRQAIAQIPPELEKLTDIGAQPNRLEQKQRVDRLRPLVKSKLDELSETIDLRRSQGPDAALAVVRTDRGKAVMDQIRDGCAEIEAASYAFAEQQTVSARANAERTAFIAVGGSAGIFVLLALATLTIEKGTRRRQELIAALEDRESRLRNSSDWLRTTLSSIGDAVITTDGEGRITLLNDVAQSVTGWRQEDAAGKPLEKVFVICNEDTGEGVENPVSKVLREGRVVGLANHTVLVAKDGRRVPIDDCAAPIRAGSGKIDGVVLVFRDITGRKESEEAALRGIAELRISNAALMRANEDLNRFTFAASHDLQEPLRMITSYSQLLVKGYRGELGGEAGKCIEFITEGTRRMRELLADLLDYTRVAAEDEQPIEAVDLNRVFKKTLDACKGPIDETGATVTSDRLPTIQARESHFLQLFQNLISNSLKYRSERTPHVHVSAEKENGGVRIAFKDNGIGIAPEYHDQIFGVFKRLHGKTIPGTGIGLAICQRVVHRYGGEIWVESKVNEGAAFYFTIPGAQKGATAHEG